MVEAQQTLRMRRCAGHNRYRRSPTYIAAGKQKINRHRKLERRSIGFEHRRMGSPPIKAIAKTYLRDLESHCKKEQQVADTIEIYGSRSGKRYPQLILTRGSWCLDDYSSRKSNSFVIKGQLMFKNLSAKEELFIPEIDLKVKLLSTEQVKGIEVETEIIPRHDLSDGYESPDSCPRRDGYWSAYIVKGECSTYIDVMIDINCTKCNKESLTSCCVEVAYECYGPSGIKCHKQHIVLPLSFPDPTIPPVPFSGSVDESTVIPINTHLLYHDDDPIQVVEKYVKPHALPGDVLAIAETPLAIMQGRYRHPSTIQPSWFARLCCRCFHPTSSLATACGMQALIDVSGVIRVLVAVIMGFIAKVFGKAGVFYKIAGEQARLIDDITGTIPPYDKFICLGPKDCKEIVQDIKSQLDIETVIVDVNDLSKKTKLLAILAKTDAVDTEKVYKALLPNPAGNADQQTPFVLIRH